MFDSLISSLFINSVLALRLNTQPSVPNFPSVCLSCMESQPLGVCRDIYFILCRKFFIWVFHWNFSYFMLTSCSVCRTVPGVLIFNHRLQDLLLNPVFWSLSCSRHLYFSFWWENIPFMMRFLLSLAFSVLRFIYQKCTRGYYTNRLCSKSAWPSVPGFQHSM